MINKTPKTTIPEPERKLDKAKENYEKLIADIAPFIPKPKLKETTTEGKWQTTDNLSLD